MVVQFALVLLLLRGTQAQDHKYWVWNSGGLQGVNADNSDLTSMNIGYTVMNIVPRTFGTFGGLKHFDSTPNHMYFAVCQESACDIRTVIGRCQWDNTNYEILVGPYEPEFASESPTAGMTFLSVGTSMMVWGKTQRYGGDTALYAADINGSDVSNVRAWVPTSAFASAGLINSFEGSCRWNRYAHKFDEDRNRFLMVCQDAGLPPYGRETRLFSIDLDSAAVTLVKTFSVGSGSGNGPTVITMSLDVPSNRVWAAEETSYSELSAQTESLDSGDTVVKTMFSVRIQYPGKNEQVYFEMDYWLNRVMWSVICCVSTESTYLSTLDGSDHFRLLTTSNRFMVGGNSLPITTTTTVTSVTTTTLSVTSVTATSTSLTETSVTSTTVSVTSVTATSTSLTVTSVTTTTESVTSTSLTATTTTVSSSTLTSTTSSTTTSLTSTTTVSSSTLTSTTSSTTTSLTSTTTVSSTTSTSTASSTTTSSTSTSSTTTYPDWVGGCGDAVVVEYDGESGEVGVTGEVIHPKWDGHTLFRVIEDDCEVEYVAECQDNVVVSTRRCSDGEAVTERIGCLAQPREFDCAFKWSKVTASERKNRSVHIPDPGQPDIVLTSGKVRASTRTNFGNSTVFVGGADRHHSVGMVLLQFMVICFVM